jgi:hypothetical protein
MEEWTHRPHRLLGVLAAAIVLLPLAAVPVAAHERRGVGEYELQVGFLFEPTYVGQENGVFLGVRKGDQPVEGVSNTLEAEVTYAGFPPRELPLVPIFEEPGTYESIFYPTTAGKYSFRFFGQIEDMEVDETFTSGDTTFDSVKDAGEGQYPVALPPEVQVAEDAERGADAADLVPIALGIAITGLMIGLVALAIAVAARRREA